MTLLDFASLFAAVARFLIVISIVIGVIFIVWAGITYMMAGDDIARTEAAKSRAKNTIISVFIVLAVGLIIQTLASITLGISFFNS